jgi:hypothetical protein
MPAVTPCVDFPKRYSALSKIDSVFPPGGARAGLARAH